MEIKVEVPEERLAEFYSWFGAWLTGDRPAPETPGSQDMIGPKAPDTGGSQNPPPDWTEEDGDLAEWLWPKLSPNANALFSHFIDRPDEKFNGDQAAEAAGIAGGGYSVAGILGWPGIYCHQVNRGLPIRYSPEGYWMESDIAKIFREVRDSN
jgi:hypothetical protein